MSCYMLVKLNHLVYIHFIKPYAFALRENPHDLMDGSIERTFRKIYDDIIVTATDHDRASVIEVVDRGDNDMVAFCRYFISNSGRQVSGDHGASERGQRQIVPYYGPVFTYLLEMYAVRWAMNAIEASIASLTKTFSHQ